MKMLATKVFALCLLVALQDRNALGTDEEPGEALLNHPAELEGSTSNGSHYEENERINVAFKAFGKDFFAAIHPEMAIFAKNAEVKIHGGDGMEAESLPIEQHYGGHLEGLANTAVVGQFSRGVFDGVIVTDEDDYFVKPADRYNFPPHPVFNAVVYKALFPNRENAFLTTVNVTGRTRRAVTGIPNSVEGSPPARVCTVKVVVDNVHPDRPDHDRETAVSEAQYYVAMTDSIFRGTDFDGDGRPGDVRLVISGVEVFESVGLGPANLTAADLDGACAGLVLTRLRPQPDDEKAAAARICSSGQRSNAVTVSLLAPDGTPRSHAATAALVAHGFGHLFGSPDDDRLEDARCLPDSPADRFVMSPQPLTGRTVSNRRFSECSRRSVGQFLRTADARRCLNHRVDPITEETPATEVADNALPDERTDQLQAAKGSMMSKRKKEKKMQKPKKTTNATTSTTTTTMKSAKRAPKSTTKVATRPQLMGRADNATAGAQNVTTAQSTTTVRDHNATTVRAPSSAVTRSVVKRPWQAMAVSLVTFSVVRFRILG